MIASRRVFPKYTFVRHLHHPHGIPHVPLPRQKTASNSLPFTHPASPDLPTTGRHPLRMSARRQRLRLCPYPLTHPSFPALLIDTRPIPPTLVMHLDNAPISTTRRPLQADVHLMDACPFLTLY